MFASHKGKRLATVAMDPVDYEEHVDENGWVLIYSGTRSDSSDLDDRLQYASASAGHESDGGSQDMGWVEIGTERLPIDDLPEDVMDLQGPNFSTPAGVPEKSDDGTPKEKKGGEYLYMYHQDQQDHTLYQSDKWSGVEMSDHRMEEDEEHQPGANVDGSFLAFDGGSVPLTPTGLDQDWILGGLSIRIDGTSPYPFLDPTRRTIASLVADGQLILDASAEASDGLLWHMANASGAERPRHDGRTVQRGSTRGAASSGAERLISGNEGFPRDVERLPQFRGEWVIDGTDRPRGLEVRRCNNAVPVQIPVQQYEADSCRNSELSLSTPAVGILVVSDGFAGSELTRPSYSLDMYQKRRHDDPWTVFSGRPL